MSGMYVSCIGLGLCAMCILSNLGVNTFIDKIIGTNFWWDRVVSLCELVLFKYYYYLYGYLNTIFFKCKRELNLKNVGKLYRYK